MDYIKNKVNETGAKQIIGSTSNSQVTVVNVKNAKQNDLISTLQGNILNGLKNIRQRYSRHIFRCKDIISHSEMMLTNRDGIIDDDGIVDFRTYRGEIKLLCTNIDRYISANDISDIVLEDVQQEIKTLQGTISINIQPEDRLYSKKIDQINTLTNCLTMLQNSYNKLEKAYKKQEEDKKGTITTGDISLTTIYGRYGKRFITSKGDNVPFYSTEVYHTDEKTGQQVPCTELFTGVKEGLPLDMNNEEYFKISLIDELSSLRETVNVLNKDINDNHNIENAILKLNKTISTVNNNNKIDKQSNLYFDTVNNLSLILEKNHRATFVCNEDIMNKFFKQYYNYLENKNLFSKEYKYAYNFNVLFIPNTTIELKDKKDKCVCVFCEKKYKEPSTSDKVVSEHNIGTTINYYMSFNCMPNESKDDLFIVKDILKDNQDDKIKEFSNNTKIVFI